MEYLSVNGCNNPADSSQQRRENVVPIAQYVKPTPTKNEESDETINVGGM